MYVDRIPDYSENKVLYNGMTRPKQRNSSEKRRVKTLEKYKNIFYSIQFNSIQILLSKLEIHIVHMSHMKHRYEYMKILYMNETILNTLRQT